MSGTQQANMASAIAYYTNALALQYRTLPKASASISILVKQAIADLFAQTVEECYDLATATGVQLDTIAKYIGVSRNSNVAASVNFFGYQIANGGGGSAYGYNSVLSALNGYIYDSVVNANLPTTAFTDIQFRFILQLQIALNHFDGTLAYIQQFLYDYFPGQIDVVDNLNMSLTYYVLVPLPISNTTLQNFLPCPMGCGISVVNGTPGATRITTDGATRVTSGGATRVTTGI